MLTVDGRSIRQVQSQISASDLGRNSGPSASSSGQSSISNALPPELTLDYLGIALGQALNSPKLVVKDVAGRRCFGPAGELCNALFGTNITSSNALKACQTDDRLRVHVISGEIQPSTVPFSAKVVAMLTAQGIEQLIRAHAAKLVPSLLDLETSVRLS